MDQYDNDDTETDSIVGDPTRRFETEFIKKYQCLPILWDVNHPDYPNKYRRTLALDELLEILKTVNNTATRFNVRQKINVLRSCYRKELRRKLASKEIGPDGNIMYTYLPSSWKFHALAFLGRLEKKRKYKKKKYADIDVDESYEDQTQEDSDGSDEPVSRRNTTDYNEYNETDTLKRSCKRTKLNYKDHTCENTNEDDILERELEAVGSNVSCKLRRMTQQQRYTAELLINQILIKGLNNHLTNEANTAHMASMPSGY